MRIFFAMDHESIAAFYELARAMASAERDRFEQAETKAWRHLYVLVVLLGFALATFGRTVLQILESPPSPLGIGFVALWVVFLGSAFSAGLVSVWNFRVALTLEPPVDSSIQEFAVHSSVERFHLELGREFIRSAAENRRVADRKYRLLVWNFRLLIAALSLGMALGVLFILLSRGS